MAAAGSGLSAAVIVDPARHGEPAGDVRCRRWQEGPRGEPRSGPHLRVLHHGDLIRELRAAPVWDLSLAGRARVGEPVICLSRRAMEPRASGCRGPRLFSAR